MNIPIIKIPFSKSDIAEITQSISEILSSGQLAMGKNVTQFESLFAEFCHTDYAIATNSGTSALEIILRSIGVRNHTVICPTNTFMATPISAIHAGAKVIFTDIAPDDLCINPIDLSQKIRKDTKAVILVHNGGTISNHYDYIKDLCEDRNIHLIEDAAHAHGSTINNQPAGSLGFAGAFSFYPTKVLTCGEGGMITTDDDTLLHKAMTLRDHGKPDHRYNIHTEPGYNWRMSEIHAAIGLNQLKSAGHILSERRKIAVLYDKNLPEALTPMKIPSHIESSYYKYITFLPDYADRDTLKQNLSKKGIQLTGEVYADPCHSQPVFKKYPYMVANSVYDKFPVAERRCKNHICLPLYPGLTEDEVMYVYEELNEELKVEEK